MNETVEKPVEKARIRSPRRSLDWTAGLRLALLVAPFAVIVKALGQHPLWCAIVSGLFVMAWLLVDVWPFRAAPVST